MDQTAIRALLYDPLQAEGGRGSYNPTFKLSLS
jgi:hypothetical protein